MALLVISGSYPGSLDYGLGSLWAGTVNMWGITYNVVIVGLPLCSVLAGIF